MGPLGQDLHGLVDEVVRPRSSGGSHASPATRTLATTGSPRCSPGAEVTSILTGDIRSFVEANAQERPEAAGTATASDPLGPTRRPGIAGLQASERRLNPGQATRMPWTDGANALYRKVLGVEHVLPGHG